ncbi:DUF4328 domain-containing protein [Streptomyces sp. A0592]|uniref:DUF4328 domain-containing protein n=1 Tax=Streptomyces sp. A0592 TaxID=2563099 RepID=UPI00109EB1AA|nr:DUF4328 domain-containing protein [Streptomyces sp. A0592]THA86907.1 DUF4328 domain-containing protein [Streptomyces sp. A0592]
MSAVPAGPPVPSPDAGPVVTGVRLRAAVALAVALTVLCVLFIGCSAYAVYADWTTWALMERLVSDPGAVGDAELGRGESLFLLASSVQTRAMIVACVVFIVWFHVVRANARVFAQNADTGASAVAVRARFVPLSNLWLPYRIATTWVSSRPRGAADGSRRFPSTLVDVWWGAFVAARVLGWCGGMAYALAQSPGAVRHAATALLVGDVLDIVAAVLAPLFVIGLTAMQRSRPTRNPAVATVRL